LQAAILHARATAVAIAETRASEAWLKLDHDRGQARVLLQPRVSVV
jgi:hypothetical protein